MPLRKLLIANRGEIAVRLLRAARERGLATVLAASEADRDSLAAGLADEVEIIGPPPVRKSYLDPAAILAAAERSGADSLHPGYGFLSENAAFADEVREAGLVFVGPTGDTIRRMGDKAAARRTAAEAGVPVVPGSEGRVEDPEEAARLAGEIGYPLMIKAAAGGGGRGIRVVHDAAELRDQALRAQAEAEAAFGDRGIYLEKYIERARHIEVQVLGDGERAIHLFERECTLQRRHQKVWEEAPSASLTPEKREELCAAAARLAEGIGYSGAGTVEFIYDDRTGDFFFLEMNTRLQVEHPTTEMVTGVDLVRAMLGIAGGEGLQLRQEEVVLRGHSIEVRINAEDYRNQFFPSLGRVDHLRLPGGPGVRFDTLLYPGYDIPPFYDSLLGKLIVHDLDREHALGRLRAALGELDTAPVVTTAGLFSLLVEDPDVRALRFDTQWLEQRLPGLLEEAGAAPTETTTR